MTLDRDDFDLDSVHKGPHNGVSTYATVSEMARNERRPRSDWQRGRHCRRRPQHDKVDSVSMNSPIVRMYKLAIINDGVGKAAWGAVHTVM